ncbi:MAG: cation diffusion facilitator family transporter [Eubacteriales bacterium]|nr:cation diffusion facilitator family transporter [Eubacteriales bacterium]
MIAFLARKLIAGYENTGESTVRQQYGMLAGAVGIFFNIVLFLIKFLAGTLSGSIAITADAFNNLSDAGSSVITMAGFRMAGQKPDSEHPFGHGRIEYLTGLFVSILIILMGFELLRTSFGKILSPEETSFGPLTAAILLASICVKLYMYSYNTALSQRLGSVALRSAAMDSFSDSVATCVVFLCSAVSMRTGLLLDGFCGLAVSAFILRTGLSSALETINPLLGQPPDAGFVSRITQIVKSYDHILGVHDLVVHDYGPGRRFVSLHAEVPASLDLQQAHEIIDAIEMRLDAEFHMETVIHMDPVCENDPETESLRRKIRQILSAVGPEIRFHDFRLVRGRSHTNVIFDVVLPYQFPMKEEALVSYLKTAIADIDCRYRCIIHVDHEYTA